MQITNRDPIIQSRSTWRWGFQLHR